MLFNREAGCKRVNGNGISKQNGQDSQHFPLYVCVSILPHSHPPSFMSQDWLTKFGYLPPPDPITGQLQTQEELTKAITAMQRFGGLEATGVLGQWVARGWVDRGWRRGAGSYRDAEQHYPQEPTRG